jgi:CBS domain-containing protein
MLVLLVEENGLHGMPPKCGAETETGTATHIHEIGG